jgi:hypothetical protein
VLVRDLPGGSAVIPRFGRGAAPRGVAAPVPARRRRSVSPAVPAGAGLLVVGGVWLALAALPPLLGIVLGAVLLSVAIAVGIFALAMAPVGLAVFGLAWLAQRVFGAAGRPYGWPGGPRPRSRR